MNIFERFSGAKKGLSAEEIDSSKKINLLAEMNNVAGDIRSLIELSRKTFNDAPETLSEINKIESNLEEIEAEERAITGNTEGDRALLEEKILTVRELHTKLKSLLGHE
jgi:hypothetical protein